MYEVSQEYKRAIRRQTRKFEWQGTITTTAGKVYHFTTKDIVKGSGTLTRSCAGSTSLELGSVYAAELDISLFLDVDRYSLYDAVIDLSFVCRHSVKRVWNDLRPFTWGAMHTKRWNDRGESETIPMGKFVVSEATRTLTILQLKAYDYMLKFDKNMKNSGTVRKPYEWLKYACENCHVPLGVTEEAVAAMPNGTRSLSWTNLDEDKTWRDLIAHVATVLCGVCQIDRSGALTVIPFTNTPVMDIPASWRYSSKIADYITKYTGLYATYRAGGLTEYYNVEPDDGLIYNIGTNPLLQIAATTLRSEILQGIIDNLAATTYTPFEADIPGDPSLDPMDVLSLFGGQATGEIACITEIVYRINGKSHIKLDANKIAEKVKSPRFGEAAKLALEIRKEYPIMKRVDFWWVDDLIDHIEFGAHSRTEREYRRLAALGENVTDDRTMKVFWKCGLITTVMSGVDADREHPPMIAGLYNSYLERQKEAEKETEEVETA